MLWACCCYTVLLIHTLESGHITVCGWIRETVGGKQRKTFWLNTWVFCWALVIFFLVVILWLWSLWVFVVLLGFFKEGMQMALWSCSECWKLFQNWKSLHKSQIKCFQNTGCPIGMLNRYVCTRQADLSMYCVACVSQLRRLEMSTWWIT